jgi:hypothetical protein
MGSIWGGTLVWVRAQGEAIAKSIWYHSRWDGDSVVSVNWAGMTDAEREENRVWCEEFARKNEEEMENESDAEGSEGSEDWSKNLECRGGCGEVNSKLVCSRCKETRTRFMFYNHREMVLLIKCVVLLGYCSRACQKEDWKVIASNLFTAFVPLC